MATGAMAFACLTGASHAIVSTTAATSQLGAGESFLSGVARLDITRGNNSVALCSGSLVGGGAYILTAAHCIAGTTTSEAATSVSITLPGVSAVRSSSFAVNPTWTSAVNSGADVQTLISLGSDLAVIRLPGVIAAQSAYALGTGQSAQGQTVVLAGYGYSGNGQQGVTNTTFGTLRYGLNQYDSPTNNNLPATYLYDFDSGLPRNNTFGSAGLGTSEVMIAPGDSGGPSLLQIGSTWTVVGVHSFDSCTFGNCPVNSSFGETGADIALFDSTNAAWLQSVIVVAVPEPEMPAMFTAGLVVLGVAARRRARRQ
jgi:hypothetical protein